MKYFLKEYQTKILTGRIEMEEALEHYKETDEWLSLTADEIRAFGVSDIPLFTGDIRKEFGDDAIFDDCVKNAGIFLAFPGKDLGSYRTYAARDIGMDSIYNRSGTNCRIVRTLDNRKNIKALSAEERGEIINKGFSTTKENVKILISDGRVSFIGSERYTILPYDEGINAAELTLTQKFEEMSYKTGYISHEFFVAEYTINDPEVDAYRLMLKDFGMPVTENASIIFRFSSSNVGDAKMSGRLLIDINGIYLPIGKACAIWHKNGSSILDFQNEIEKLGSVMQENEDLIESLGNTVINYPSGCLQSMLEFCPSIPAKKKEQAVEDFEKIHPVSCMAIDVYLAAAGLLSGIEGLRTILQATEEVAELQYRNFQAYDKERK